MRQSSAIAAAVRGVCEPQAADRTSVQRVAAKLADDEFRSTCGNAGVVGINILPAGKQRLAERINT